MTAKLVYSLLLDRATLSRKNGWIDEQGRIYIVFPIENLSAVTHKGITAVKEALHELDTVGLIERKRNFSAPNSIYVKLPTESRENGQTLAGKPSEGQPEKRLCGGRKSGQLTAGKPSTNQTNINKTDRSKTREGKKPAPKKYGSYGNVLLTDTEYQKLNADIPYLDSLIEQLSAYMVSTGKRYKNHAATLRVWAARDRKQSKPRSSAIPDYRFEEGESL